jgi:hypothetical protein
VKLSEEKIELIHNAIYIALYDWRLHLAEQEINSEFYILSLMQRPQIELKIKQIIQLNHQQQKLTLQGLIKQTYSNQNITEFELTEEENNLILPLANLSPYTIYPDDSGDIDNHQYRPNKKIYRRKLFNRMKNKIQQYQELKADFHVYDSCKFVTDIGNGFQIVTNISSDTMCYNYYQDVYKDNNRIKFLANYPVLVGLPCFGWAIYQDEDIEIALHTILECCQQFILKISEIINNLDLIFE